jgi:hypothetical protein
MKYVIQGIVNIPDVVHVPFERNFSMLRVGTISNALNFEVIGMFNGEKIANDRVTVRPLKRSGQQSVKT